MMMSVSEVKLGQNATSQQPHDDNRDEGSRCADAKLTFTAKETEINKLDDSSRSETPVSNAAPITERAPAPGPPQQTGPEDNYKPKTAKFWLVLISAFIATFIVALDRTILSTAIPQITNDFDSLGDIGWYGSSYMLATAAFQLVFGRIYRFYDLRSVFLICIVVFEIGSAICGSAPNSIAFIIGRTIAGIASAGIMTGSMLVMIPMIPLHKRPMFQCRSSSNPHTLFATAAYNRHSYIWINLRRVIGSRASDRWRVHGNRHMALVLLHESAHRRRSFCLPLFLSRLAKEGGTARSDQGTAHAARSSRHVILRSVHDLLDSSSSVGWVDI